MSEEELTPKKTIIELDNEVIAHVIALVDQALGLSRDNAFSPVSFDYTQLELLKKMLSIAVTRGNQLQQLSEVLATRKDELDKSINNINQVLSNVSGALEQLKQAIPKVTLK